jgi:hypothetical protein
MAMVLIFNAVEPKRVSPVTVSGEGVGCVGFGKPGLITPKHKGQRQSHPTKPSFI